MYFFNKENQISGIEKIKTAFFSLIKDDNSNITITDICKYAQVNRSTFYAHFSDINQMYDFMEGELTKSANLDKSELTNQNLTKVLHFIKKHRNFYKFYFSLPHTNISNLIYKTQYPNEVSSKYISAFQDAGTKDLIKLWLNNNCKDDTKEISNILLKLLSFNKS